MPKDAPRRAGANVAPLAKPDTVVRWHWAGFRFVIRHGRRHIVHFDVTDHPAAPWVVQQLREAFPFDTAPKHLVFDRDSIFSAEVMDTGNVSATAWYAA